MAAPVIPITGNSDADRLLVEDPFALLIGMLLDQQVPMEVAFRAPWVLKQRLGGRLDAATVAAMDPEALEAVFREKPALHRFPASMAKRAHALATHVMEKYGGDAAAIWRGTDDPEVVLERLRALPGYGDEKAKIFLAILGKRLGAAPAGWEKVASPFGDPTPRSIADVDSDASLAKVREWKRAQKAKGKGKAE
jgi:uncharacterized HhH-GPD family protein